MQNEWISVKDRLPEESGNYLCASGRVCQILHFSEKYKRFNVRDSFNQKEACLMGVHITHWMPLPELPKGE